MSGAPIGLAIIGAGGRMGGSLLRLLPGFPDLRLQAALESPGYPGLGADSGLNAGIAANGVPLGADLAAGLRGAGLAIAFSAAGAAPEQLRACAAAGVPLLLGTTGVGPELGPEVQRAAARIPVLVSANTSLAVTLLQELVRQAAAALPAEFDIQIVETHHPDKRDAPSGTALSLGAAAGVGRAGHGRPVGYASLRGGDVVGEHEVHFLGLGERLRLAHSATDRSVFARGALRAGSWLARQAPGSYRMADVFGEK